MARIKLQPGTAIDGFVLEELLHKGGMSRLWRVSKPGIETPLLMKVPIIGEGEDPAAIVGFEMEQMIMPHLSGVHVPRFVASGDFSVQPYIVMERILGQSLLGRLKELPLPCDEVAALGVKIATALDDLHRQNVVHLDLKPSNVIVRPSGDVALIDFGLSHHAKLPDLMQEEFRLPYGTAPYMAPEQLLGQRHDPRSDLFAVGVLLYFFATGVRPFGEATSRRRMMKRLWRDPVPPRRLKRDMQPWFQEIVLRCLEPQPAWRYPTAAQLAFDLSHPDQVKLTARAERLQQDPWTAVLRRRFNNDHVRPIAQQAVAEQVAGAPIVAVAVELDETSDAVKEALRATAQGILKALPSARLACLNVLKLGILSIDSTLDEHGNSKHVDRLIRLKHWAEPLKLPEAQVSYHVLEAIDPAASLLDYAEANRVDHLVIGARQNSLRRMVLGSTSSKVAAEAKCTVTIVRTQRAGTQDEGTV